MRMRQILLIFGIVVVIVVGGYYVMAKRGYIQGPGTTSTQSTNLGQEQTHEPANGKNPQQNGWGRSQNIQSNSNGVLTAEERAKRLEEYEDKRQERRERASKHKEEIRQNVDALKKLTANKATYGEALELANDIVHGSREERLAAFRAYRVIGGPAGIRGVLDIVREERGFEPSEGYLNGNAVGGGDSGGSSDQTVTVKDDNENKYDKYALVNNAPMELHDMIQKDLFQAKQSMNVEMWKDTIEILDENAELSSYLVLLRAYNHDISVPVLLDMMSSSNEKVVAKAQDSLRLVSHGKVFNTQTDAEAWYSEFQVVQAEREAKKANK